MNIEEIDNVVDGNSVEITLPESKTIATEPEDDMSTYFWLSISFLVIFIMSYFIL